MKEDGDEFKAGIDLINFGMPREEELVADTVVYKKAKKLTMYAEETKGDNSASDQTFKSTTR